MCEYVKFQPVPYRQHSVFHKKDQTFDALLEINSYFCKIIGNTLMNYVEKMQIF